jgi:hypothetical protein
MFSGVEHTECLPTTRAGRTPGVSLSNGATERPHPNHPSFFKNSPIRSSPLSICCMLVAKLSRT